MQLFTHFGLCIVILPPPPPPPRVQCGKRGESNFAVEKSGNHYLSQGIKVIINISKSCWQYMLLI